MAEIALLCMPLELEENIRNAAQAADETLHAACLAAGRAASAARPPPTAVSGARGELTHPKP